MELDDVLEGLWDGEEEKEAAVTAFVAAIEGVRPALATPAQGWLGHQVGWGPNIHPSPRRARENDRQKVTQPSETKRGDLARGLGPVR